jgi:hypothetical protein
MDRGANGGISATTHAYPCTCAKVTGIDNHELNALKLVDAASKIITHKGPAIGIFRQYAWTQLLYSFLRTIRGLQEQG